MTVLARLGRKTNEQLHANRTAGQGMTAHKFKIGQSVRLRTVQTHQAPAGEYRIIRQLPQTDGNMHYRVRSSADEQREMVVKESELLSWPDRFSIYVKRRLRGAD
jgi:hypothetical protein